MKSLILKFRGQQQVYFVALSKSKGGSFLWTLSLLYPNLWGLTGIDLYPVVYFWGRPYALHECGLAISGCYYPCAVYYWEA